jgi:hypothetical protein
MIRKVDGYCADHLHSPIGRHLGASLKPFGCKKELSGLDPIWWLLFSIGALERGDKMPCFKFDLKEVKDTSLKD